MSQSIKEVVQQIIKLRQDVHEEIGSLRQDMHKDIGVLRQDMHKEVGGLRQEMHQLRGEMNSRFSNLEKDMEAVKTRLGMRDETTRQVRGHFIDYSFKASWVVMLAVLSGAFSFLAGRI